MANGNQLLTPQDLVALMNQRDQLQQRRQQLASQPVNPGLLTEGQESIGDFFKNPTQAQRAALLQTGISLLGSMDRPNTLANIGTALQSGLGTLGQARAARRQASLEDIDAQIKQAQERFGNTLDVAKLQQGQQRIDQAGQQSTTPNPTVVNVKVGVDDNGNPVFQQRVIDQKAILRGDPGATVGIPVGDPTAARTPADAAKIREESDKVDASLQNISRFGEILTDPEFPSAVGAKDFPLAQAERLAGTKRGAIAGAVGRLTKQAVIANLKQMGARPSDKDLQVLMDTKPRRLAEEREWYDWFANDYAPFVLDTVRKTAPERVEAVEATLLPQLEQIRTLQAGLPASTVAPPGVDEQSPATSIRWEDL